MVRNRVANQLRREFPRVTIVFSSAVVRGMPIDGHNRWHVQASWLWPLLAKDVPDTIQRLLDAGLQPDDEAGMVTALLAELEIKRAPKAGVNAAGQTPAPADPSAPEEGGTA